MAEADFEKDVRTTIRGVLFSASGDAEPGRHRRDGHGPKLGGGATEAHGCAGQCCRGGCRKPTSMPMRREFQKSGFRGGLELVSQHRSKLGAARAVERRKPSTCPRSTWPAIATSCLRFAAWISLLANLKRFIPKLDETIILPGCGHWTQQERPDEVNAALLRLPEEAPSLADARGSRHALSRRLHAAARTAVRCRCRPAVVLAVDRRPIARRTSAGTSIARVGRGAVAVFDVESNNDLHRILNEWADIIPAHFDTYPLVDTQATAQLLAAQVAAKK